MNERKNDLVALTKIKRHAFHPLIHEIHKKHGISKKTLLYIKEYGPHSNIPKTIVKESLQILIFASIISSIGGFALEYIKNLFVSLLPLIILLPSLNDMIGDFGTITSAKFSLMLHEGIISKNPFQDKKIRKLFYQIMVIAIFNGIICAIVSFFLANLNNYFISLITALKILFLVIIDVIFLICILFFTSIIIGLHIFKKNEDPNNFLIPITTSIADFGNIVIFALLVKLLFA